MANVCGANPSPPTGAPAIQIFHPFAKHRIARPIRIVRQAVATEATFGITFYD